MATIQCSNATHHAILIGIDAYPSSPLKSCVNDIRKVNKCLSSLSNRVPINIHMLTASGDCDPATVASDVWPTCRNVTAILEHTRDQAKHGDYVYIHFCGHGTRYTPCFDFSDPSRGDLALVLLKNQHSRNELLLGPQLAGFLKSMGDKGLIVTVVLDCCFSASVYRTEGDSVRFLPVDRITDVLDTESSIAIADYNATVRNATMRDNWLLDPDRYAILAACGPHENAKGGVEMSLKGERFGALSYFLCQTISEHGFEKRIRDIHRHLRSRFWEACVLQNPVLFGNASQGFFGPVGPDVDSKSICVVKSGKEFYLLAGQAHGFKDGDSFNIHSNNSVDKSSPNVGCTAVISVAGPLTSSLHLSLDVDHSGVSLLAQPTTQDSLATFFVQWASSIRCHEECRSTLNRRAIGVRCDSLQNPALQVQISSNDSYEILDQYGLPIKTLPDLAINDTGINRICDVVEHLARYKAVEQLHNTENTTDFRASFNVQILSNTSVLNSNEKIEVEHGSRLTVKVQNTGTAVIYAHIYDMDSCWRVKGLLYNTYEAIPPRQVSRNGEIEFTGIFEKPLRMTVPPMMRDEHSCKDIIKVFVTSQPTSFEFLELPALEGLVKGGSSFRHDKTDGSKPEDWAAVDFHIYTSRK